MGKHDNAIASGVGFWLLGESLGGGGKILGVRKSVRAGPSLSSGFVTDEIINIGEDFLELSAGELSNEGNRGVEDEDPRSV